MGGGLSEERKNDYCYWGKGPYGKEPYGERTIGGGGQDQGAVDIENFLANIYFSFYLELLSCIPGGRKENGENEN